MKIKYYIIRILLLGFCILNSTTVSAIPLTNSLLSVSELNGTNGFTIIDSKGNLFGYTVTYVNDTNNDGYDDFCIAGRTNLDYYYADVFFSNTNEYNGFYNAQSFDGTNGYTVFGPVGTISGHIPASWSDGSYLLCGCRYGLGQEYGTGCCTLLKLKYPGKSSEIITTDTWWDVSLRAYSQESPPVLSGVMINDFIDSKYALSYNTTNGPVIFNITNFANEAFYVPTNTSNFVHFIGNGLISNVDDVNNDTFDDIFIGSHLIFGGRNWAGEVELDNIDTNVVKFDSIFFSQPWPFPGEPHTIGNGNMGDINNDGINDISYVDSGWFEGDFEQILAIVYGQTNWPTTFNANLLNGHNGFVINPLWSKIYEVARQC